ncbi:sentrin-specific protease 1-like [Daktulosphaira vitifoliae]|uniref:sentrin-specific protease 1-like n=1 Tax=Daktulosphaira vitifoliae TaxID=58002 RepID=UPI0021AA55C7|nr:sentrin-specific protease 1-like [Daktulosphaira vitifoliae]
MLCYVSIIIDVNRDNQRQNTKNWKSPVFTGKTVNTADIDPNYTITSQDSFDFFNKKIIMSSVSPPIVYDDVTVNTFMKLIVERSQSQVYAFDTLFILELKKSGFDVIHQQIIIDLFEKTLLLAPLYVNNNHWILVVVHVSNKDITFYDNMNCTISEMIWKIRQFIIFCELKQYGCTSHWQIYRGETTTLNYNDECGPGIVEIAERISRGYPPLINLSLLKNYMKNQANFRRKLLTSIS